MKTSVRLLIAVTALGCLLSCSYAARDYEPDKLSALIHKCTKRNNADSCGKLSNYYFHHDNIKEDVSHACEYAEMSCHLGNLKDCPIASSDICHIHDKTNPSNSVRYWEFGCKGNDPEDCISLAKFAQQEHDYVKTIDFYEKACSMDIGENKTHACEDLDKLYNSGYGLKEDPEQMKVVFKKACAQKKHKACRSLSRIFHSKFRHFY